MARPPTFTDEKREKFLQTLKATADVRVSARAADVNWSTVYRLRKRSVKFAKAWDDALDEGLDHLEGIAYRLARGQVGKDGVELKAPSERMVMFILSRRRRKKWGETLTHRGDTDEPIDHRHVWELDSPPAPNHPPPTDEEFAAQREEDDAS